MAFSSSPYDIIRTQDVCAQTGRALEVGEEHIAALIESTEQEAFVRVAYSFEAWEEGPRLPPEASVFGFWKRIVPESNEEPKQLIGDDELLDLFEQLGEADQDKQLAFRYLLTLVLMRKKKLILEQSTPATKEDRGSLLVRLRQRGGQGPVFTVIDPGLTDETIMEATEELGQIMNLDENGV